MGTNPKSNLSANQVLQKCYNADTDRLRVDTSVSIESPAQEVIISDIDDSIKIGDGTGTYLDVNPDGSINVSIVGATSGTSINEFNEVASIASGIDTIILSYTVPAFKKLYISRIDVSGENIAKYDVLLDSSTIARKRTYFGGDLNATFEFSLSEQFGYLVNPGGQIDVRVLHMRPSSGDFEARLIGILKDI